jgi:CHAD domain-containing protein
MSHELTQTLERELKLRASQDFALPELPGERIAEKTLTSIYYDTPDHRLAAAGITLRHRVEDDKRLWQLKLPRRNGRLEVELRGHAGAPPRELADLLLAHARGAQLRPVTTLRTRRSGQRVRSIDGSVADVLVDDVTVLDGPRVVRRFTELEVELVGGDEGVLGQIARALRAAGATDGDTRPKALQALDLPEHVGPRAPQPGSSVGSQIAFLLATQVAALLRHDPGTRIGTDPEELHQLRVATRRLRAQLRAARQMLDEEWAEELRVELAWLGGALGPVRDLDVMLERLREEAGSLDPTDRAAFEGLLTTLEDERTEARAHMLAALASERYLALLERLERAAADPRVHRSDVTLAAVARRAYRRLRRAAHELPDEPEDDQLHALRITAKRARYAAEFAAPFMEHAPSDYIAQTKALQDVLGEHQDACVAIERLRSLANGAESVRGAFAAGQLVERERARKVEMRERFPGAWTKLERAGRATWR